jgi:small subunit ribosomal protein S2
MADVGIKELLEAGVHFGHQTRRWNPKMRRFIHGEAGGIYIIDLLKTADLLHDAQEFASTLSHRGGTVLFVGTKKQARDAVAEVATEAGMPYVNHRWLGGLLTNFQTISLRIKRLHDLERYEREGQLALLPTRERLAAQADLEKLRANLGGVKNMQRPPDAIFIIDLKTEAIAVREAQRLRIPIIGLVDTNCDPDGVEFVIPGNDDAIRSCSVIAHAIGDVVRQGQTLFREEEERARREAEERARAEAEERQRREAEEQARREAEAAEAVAGGTSGERDLETAPGTSGQSVAQAEPAGGDVPQAAPQTTGEREAARQETLVHAEGGGDRQVAEAEVAEAVAEGGRPKPDPVVPQSANREVAPAQRDNVKGTSPDPAPPAEDQTPDPASPVEDVAGTEPENTES